MLRRICQAQALMSRACKVMGREVRIMELCGTHTVSVFRNAVRQSVPEKLKIISGPGCPVCATNVGFMKAMHNLACRDDCVLAGRADLLVVSNTDAQQATVVSSVLEALELARLYTDKTVIYAAVGYETCVPGAAAAIEQADREGLDNFCILSGLKKIVPAVKSLLTSRNPDIDAFLCCGNMASITGVNIYSEIMNGFGKPCVSVGFEPMQLIEGIGEICRQLADNVREHCLDFATAATIDGNKVAQRYMETYFDVVDGYWRGLGRVENSSFALKDEFAEFDAIKRFGFKIKPVEDAADHRCGEIVCGLIEPVDCKMFGRECTQKNPVGPCMAASEGICNAWLKYARVKRN